VENERRLLTALYRLGSAWSRPLLDEADRLRDDDQRTGTGTLVRAVTTFERKGLITHEDIKSPKTRRYYSLTDQGRELVEALIAEADAKAQYDAASAKVARLI